MNADEVVPREMQCHSRFQVVQLLAESIGQTMLPEAIADNLAVVAGHCESLIEFTADLPDNDFEGSISASAVMDSGPGYRFNGDRGFLLPTHLMLAQQACQGKSYACQVSIDRCLQGMYLPLMADESVVSTHAAKGGQARASILSPEERSAIARTAARARWGEKAEDEEPSSPESTLAISKKAIAERWTKYKAEMFPPQVPAKENQSAEQSMPFSMFRGTVKIGDMDIECHVLSDERRVFTQREVVKVLSHGRDSGNLPRYLERNPLYTNQFSAGPTVDFRIPGSPTIGNGYEATLLIEICELYLEARRQKLLKPSQIKLAIQSEIIMRSCAKVGIIALIDEATGFQQVRKKRALQIKLQAFIAEEMQEWAQMFPPDFWFELARLEGIHYSPKNRPLRWGKYVMAFVYDSIDKDMGKAMRTINPDPSKGKNDHQLLTDFGRQQVHDQIQKVVTIMKLCDNMKDFRQKFDRVFKKTALQMSFTDIWEAQMGNFVDPDQ